MVEVLKVLKEMQGVGVDDRWQRSPGKHLANELRARLARLTTEARAEDYRIRPFERLSGCRFELFTK